MRNGNSNSIFMTTPISRRSFVQQVGLAGAGFAAMPRLAAADSSKPLVTLAFVGCAHIHTPGFVTLLNRRDDVRVKYVWDHDAARAKKRAPHLEAEVVSDLDAIWKDPRVQGVVICSETNRHLDLVKAAAGAGKHMFVEKPLGITARESDAMAKAIDDARLLFTTGYFMRTSPHHLFLKEQVSKGAFGTITRVSGWNCHSGSLGGWFDTEWRWMADPAQAGVGGFGDLGTHSLDILMWMFGEVEAVDAEIKVVTGRYGDCDESGQGMLWFKSGVSGTLAAGWVDVANPVTLLISGTEGHALILNDQLYFQSKQVEGADGKQPWKKLPEADPAPLDQFVDAIAGKSRPLVTPGEAAARVTVMEGLYQASKTGKRVRVG
jgi:predicted dehydrogenase